MVTGLRDEVDTDRSDPEAQTRRLADGEVQASPPTTSRSGTRVGRYLLDEPIGEGGMGVVYRAHDPALDREIAIKLVRGASGDAIAQARLVLEAKAMAVLSHPAVLPVYDVGTVDDEVFLAMELVDGRTLRAWTRERDHGWRETVAMFVAAARGLVAAHEAGLVHRDFKPANVLLARDGRVLVTDFGLARPDNALLVESQDGLSASSWSQTGELTLPNEVMGTPAFMAPEAIADHCSTAASDQFSFCVALYEALYGLRPWTTRELLTAVARDRPLVVPPGPRARKVPRSVHAAIVRGLSWDPAQRWPSLLDLVAELERARPSAHVVPVASAGTVLAMALALAFVGGSERCEDGRERLAGVWDRPTRDAVDASLRAALGPGNGDAAVHVVSLLDARATEWIRVHDETCTAALASGQSWQGDPRAECLAEHRVRLRTTAGVLADSDRHTANLALAAVSALPPASACSTASGRAGEHDARHLALRERIAEGSALLSAGRIDAAIAVARGLAAEAAELGDRALEAEAEALHGDALMEAEDDAAAADALERAFFLAQEGGDDRVARDAATSLAFVFGARMARPDDGRRWLDHAQAIASRLAPDPLADAETDTIEGAIAQREGRPEHAIEVLERALARRRVVLGDRDTRVAVTLLNLGNALGDVGRNAEARERTTEALEIWTETCGPQHPDVARTMTNLGVIAYDDGRFDEAIEHHTRALELCEAAFEDDLPCAHTMIDLGNVMWRVGRLDEAQQWTERAHARVERALGPDHPTTALALANLANVLADRGELIRAIDSWARARVALERALGPANPQVAMILANLGNTRAALGDHPHALADLEHAHEIFVSSLGPEHHQVGAIHVDIAELKAAMGDLDAAEAHHRAALRIREAALPAEHPEIAASLVGLGRVLVDRDRPEEAIDVLERAVRIVDAAEVADEERSRAHAELARARAAAR